MSIIRLLSYVIDWIFILILAAVGAVLYRIRGHTHAFSLTDPTISYPYAGDSVSISSAGVIALVVPAIITAVLSLILGGPSARTTGGRSRSQLRGRLWEWHAAWLGLATAAASAFVVTSALKDIIGKPRPNMLARCQPDISRIEEFTVSGLGASLPGAPVLVSVGICQNPDTGLLFDGFAAYPSGHTSFSFAGLVYLSLWLMYKLAAGVPKSSHHGYKTSSGGYANIEHAQQTQQSVATTGNGNSRDSAASRTPAPFLLFVIIAFVPVAGAALIGASRWYDNQHNGWDILAGAVIGTGFAWLGFRLYHPSVRSSHQEAWPARPNAGVAAFWPKMGSSGAKAWQRDVELGSQSAGNA